MPRCPPRLFLLATLLTLLAGPCFAEWRVLKDASGKIVEVAVDFAIEDFKITDAGAASFKASARIEEEPIGFHIALSQPAAREDLRLPRQQRDSLNAAKYWIIVPLSPPLAKRIP